MRHRRKLMVGSNMLYQRKLDYIALHDDMTYPYTNVKAAYEANNFILLK